jgi:hypothetical protein
VTRWQSGHNANRYVGINIQEEEEEEEEEEETLIKEMSVGETVEGDKSKESVNS